MDLYEYLQEYQNREMIPMHMPGHKRAPQFFMDNPYSWDVTEVDGTDNLYHPTGIIKQELARLKKLYQTRETYLLVNGSTCGILTAIASCCQRGDSILVARNCHQSVYHAIFLLNLIPVYLFPESDEETGIVTEVSVRQVAQALEENEVSCVVITSPTYEGIVSDVAGMAEICHKREIPLVVDAAHGAHFAWSEVFPPSAVHGEADIVVESLHKTLPCLTQTALLHRVTERIPSHRIKQYLQIFQTSSPSYVLMGSVSQCISWLEKQGTGIWEDYRKRLEWFDRQAGKWKFLRLWRRQGQDISKLIIGTWGTKMSGLELGKCLREKYGIEVEMASGAYVLAMTSVADDREFLRQLSEALWEIDSHMEKGEEKRYEFRYHRPVVSLRPYETENQKKEWVLLERSAGRVAAEYAYLYPPGIPFLAPGEEITGDIIGEILHAKAMGLALLGLQDEETRKILCIKE